jgi:hypothetical protein
VPWWCPGGAVVVEEEGVGGRTPFWGKSPLNLNPTHGGARRWSQAAPALVVALAPTVATLTSNNHNEDNNENYTVKSLH